MGANSFLSELTLNEMGGKNEIERVASPESVSIHFKPMQTGSYRPKPGCACEVYLYMPSLLLKHGKWTDLCLKAVFAILFKVNG